MRILMLLLVMTIATLQVGCTTVPSILETPDQQSMGGAEQGQIVNIRKVKLNANWKQRFSGALLGGIIGEAIGNEAVGVAGVFIGAGIATHKYGQEVDEITVEDTSGEQYQTLVEVSMFYLSDKVLFNQENGELISVSKI